MFERSSAISASAMRAIASPVVRTSCRLWSRPDERRRGRGRARTRRRRSEPKRRSNGRGSAKPAGAPDRGREARGRSRPAPRPRRASSARRRGAGCGPRRSSGARRFLGLHELGDRRADLVGEIRQQREPLGRVGRVGVVETGGDEIVVLADASSSSGASSALTRTVPVRRPARPPIVPACPSGAATPAARRAASRPTAAFDDHAGSSAGRAQLDARRRVPQQRGPGAVPAHRERQRAGPQRQRVDRDRLAEPLGREAGQELDRARPLAHEHGAQRRQEPRRVAAGVGRAQRPSTDRRSRLAGARAAGARATRDAAQPLAASSSKPQSSSAANDRGLAPRREQQIGARRVDELADRRAAARACSPRSSWRSQPRATASAPGSVAHVDDRRRRLEPSRRSRRAASCGAGPGTSSASSIGPVERGRPGRCRASPAITIVGRRSGPRPTRPAGAT